MRLSLFMRSLLFLFLLCVGTVRAQQNDLRYFVGTWHFHAWLAGNNTDSADISATWILESGLDKALALTGHVVIDGTTFTRELITYDPVAEHYTRTITANNGNHFVFTSTGWVGDTLVWNGKQRSIAGEVELKEEIERTGQDSFRATFYRLDGESWELQQTELLERIVGNGR